MGMKKVGLGSERSLVGPEERFKTTEQCDGASPWTNGYILLQREMPLGTKSASPALLRAPLKEGERIPSRVSHTQFSGYGYDRLRSVTGSTALQGALPLSSAVGSTPLRPDGPQAAGSRRRRRRQPSRGRAPTRVPSDDQPTSLSHTRHARHGKRRQLRRRKLLSHDVQGGIVFTHSSKPFEAWPRT